MIKNTGNIVLLLKYFLDQRIPIWNKILFLVPVMYLLSPFDLFPDIIFPFGLIEDFGVLFFGWQMIKKELDKYKNNRKPEKKAKRDNVVELQKDDYKVK